MEKIENEFIFKITIEYLNSKYDPLNLSGYFNFYILRVGMDESHQPDTIFVAELPVHTLFITSKKKAIEIFYEKCDFRNEYLVKIAVDKINKKFLPSIICDIPNR